MSGVTGRRGRPFASADCPDCGERGPVADDDVERARRWAVAHAAANAGHKVHLITEATRIYEADR